MFNLLFKASAETLKTLALDNKYLGAETGFISILHTWGQNLMFHPHVHIIIPGGGLTAVNQWRNSRKKFFVKVDLSRGELTLRGITPFRKKNGDSIFV